MTILWVVVDVLFVLILIKEIANAKEIRYAFKCKKCGNIIPEFVHKKIKCPKCNELMEADNHTWSHFFTHRVNVMKTKHKDYTYCYKSYIRYAKIEITLCSISILVLTICAILGL